MSEPDRFAPEGYLWVCLACGKTATDRYGIEGEFSYGWDESCSMNSSLFAKTRLVYSAGKRVQQISDEEPA